MRPTSLDKNISVISQAGSQGNGFNLYYSTAYKRWIFGRHISDTADSDVVRAMAASERPATVNQWVHLAGTYDPVARKFTLFVDGEEQGSATVTDVWNATKGLNIGRAQPGWWVARTARPRSRSRPRTRRSHSVGRRRSVRCVAPGRRARGRATSPSWAARRTRRRV
ncbi:LamG domain-containing protein [Streptomyces sp. NPDC006446]|uniref:LamG domain-containing protein n=1 Tax=Streptomyces sp. NPDC006446 TaxID=3154301 RepID=UPI0033B5EE17